MGILQAAGEMSLAIAVLIIGAGGAVAFVRAAWRWSARVGSQHDMSRAVLDTQAAIATARANIAAAQATLAEARLPRSLHYAPQLTYSPRITTSREGDLPNQAPTDPAPVHAATFAELLANGQVGKGNALLLGYSEGKPIPATWLDLYSVGIGGISGSGKSWTAAYLLSQSILHGARVAILDPHAGDHESLSARLSPLSGRFLCAVASDPRAILDVVGMTHSELDQRKRDRGARRVPWIVVADEFSSLMRGELAAPLAGLFEAIAQEGRKLAIYGMALGQVWQVSRSGGGELRDSLASCYLHRLRPNQARYLTGLTAADLPRDLLDLPAGTAYLLNNRGDMRRITTPRCTNQDIVTVAGMLTDNHPTMPKVVSDMVSETGTMKPEMTPERNRNETVRVVGSPPLSSEEMRIAHLFYSEGLDIGQIVERMHGAKLKGAAYQNAARPVQEAIRKAGLRDNPGNANGTKAPGYATI